MILEIIENYTKCPKIIYDGCEPKHIIYKIKNSKGKIECKFDIWNLWKDEKVDELIISNKNELELIYSILEFPKKKNYLSNGDERIVYKFDDYDFPISVEFVRCKENRSYIISYILNEKSPSRYQCFILAILKDKSG